MAKYLCLQRSLDNAEPAERPSPAQMQEMYAKFGEWQATFADHVVDMGGKLGAGQLVATSDGPFVEVKELVGGYMILQADSLEQAVEIAGAMPGLVRPGSGVEVVEIHHN